MKNFLNKKVLLAIFIATLASCSSNLKNSGSEKTAAVEAKKPELKKIEKVESKTEEPKIYSISADEIKKSGTKPYVVYFDTNSSKLDEKAIEVLSKNILPDAKEVSAKKVVIEAHCDERGSSAYNKKLSLKRANAVKSYLVKNGVKSKMIKAIGYGEDKPVAFGNDEESWAKNRRAVTIVIKR